ncbi:MAG: hypothetical protein E6J43_13435 [Chloroflexi bacterium]|nr:MAG: hypothetical protein E6J43_13435 [Chloroflexota bacterium]
MSLAGLLGGLWGFSWSFLLIGGWPLFRGGESDNDEWINAGLLTLPLLYAVAIVFSVVLSPASLRFVLLAGIGITGWVIGAEFASLAGDGWVYLPIVFPAGLLLLFAAIRPTLSSR